MSKKWEIKEIDSWDWKKHPLGAIITEPGNAADYHTGGWRTQRPTLDKEACRDCLTCFIFCPDIAVKVKAGKMTGFNLDHCKGCGICAYECPRKAIKMIDEAAAKNSGKGETS